MGQSTLSKTYLESMEKIFNITQDQYEKSVEDLLFSNKLLDELNIYLVKQKSKK